MVVAGGRPNVAIESAVAGCQLRYHAPFVMDSLPLFHAKQTNTLALRRMQQQKKKSNIEDTGHCQRQAGAVAVLTHCQGRQSFLS